MKKQKDILEKSWMFLIITFISIGIFVYLFYDFFNKPEFTIYKDECWNETNQIGYSCGFSYKFNNLNDNMTINFTLKPELPNYNFLFKAQEECRRIEQEAYINSMSLEYPNTLETWNNPIYETEQICEKVKVDEIELRCFNHLGELIDCKDVPEVTPPYKEETQKKDGINRIRIINCENYECRAFLKENIPEKDITKDFLYENCDCINFSCSSDCEIIYLSPDIFECRKNIKRFSDGGFEYTLCQKKCSEYKCFEDYFIEVK